MFKKLRAQAALQNFKPLMKTLTTRYARDTEARRKEKEEINHRGHRGRRGKITRIRLRGAPADGFS